MTRHELTSLALAVAMSAAGVAVGVALITAWAAEQFEKRLAWAIVET
ncbi:hypothetical protein [Rhodococcus marinonascens]|nr:hypothetical protein [Rhodococcus marinonascens]